MENIKKNRPNLISILLNKADSWGRKRLERNFIRASGKIVALADAVSKGLHKNWNYEYLNFIITNTINEGKKLGEAAITYGSRYGHAHPDYLKYSTQSRHVLKKLGREARARFKSFIRDDKETDKSEHLKYPTQSGHALEGLDRKLEATLSASIAESKETNEPGETSEVGRIPIMEYKWEDPEKIVRKIAKMAVGAKKCYFGMSKRIPESFKPELLKGEIVGRSGWNADAERLYNSLGDYYKARVCCNYNDFRTYNARLISMLSNGIKILESEN